MKKIGLFVLAMMLIALPLFGASDTEKVIDMTQADAVYLGSNVSASGNVVVESEIDTYSDLQAIVADETLVVESAIDTFAELDTIVADEVLLAESSINTFSELQAIVADEDIMIESTAPSIPTTLFNGIVGSLPLAGTVGRIAVVTDAASATDCTVGLGSTVNLCLDNGSAWVDVA